MGLHKTWQLAEVDVEGLEGDKKKDSNAEVVAAVVVVEVVIVRNWPVVVELLPETLLVTQRSLRTRKDIPSAARICEMSDMVAFGFGI